MKLLRRSGWCAATRAWRATTADALTYATETVDSLTQAQRKGIITLRGHEILNSLPKQRQALPAAHDFRERLSLSTETKEIEGQ